MDRYYRDVPAFCSGKFHQKCRYYDLCRGWSEDYFLPQCYRKYLVLMPSYVGIFNTIIEAENLVRQYCPPNRYMQWEKLCFHPTYDHPEGKIFLIPHVTIVGECLNCRINPHRIVKTIPFGAHVPRRVSIGTMLGDARYALKPLYYYNIGEKKYGPTFWTIKELLSRKDKYHGDLSVIGNRTKNFSKYSRMVRLIDQTRPPIYQPRSLFNLCECFLACYLSPNLDRLESVLPPRIFGMIRNTTSYEKADQTIRKSVSFYDYDSSIEIDLTESDEEDDWRYI
jgi:hypothetical protein